MVNNKKVIKVQCPFERIKKYNTNSEAALYRAVIMQMIIDASNISDNVKACRREKKAKEWLFSNCEDFRQICHMAGIETNVVVQLARILIKAHHEKESYIKVHEVNSKKSEKEYKARSNIISNFTLGSSENSRLNLCLLPFFKLN